MTRMCPKAKLSIFPSGNKTNHRKVMSYESSFNLINILSLQCLISLSHFYIDCPDGRFQCDNGQCIYIFEVCNGQTLCSDGSDEDNCTDFSK